MARSFLLNFYLFIFKRIAIFNRMVMLHSLLNAPVSLFSNYASPGFDLISPFSPLLSGFIFFLFFHLQVLRPYACSSGYTSHLENSNLRRRFLIE